MAFRKFCHGARKRRNVHATRALICIAVAFGSGCTASPEARGGFALPPIAASADASASTSPGVLGTGYSVPAPETHQIGPEDLLDIAVLEAEELNRAVRVSGGGSISLPLLGEIAAAGMTPRELELYLEGRLRTRYILDPHVSVQVREVQSRPVSIVGAVNRPGVFQVRGNTSLLEVLALAGGLAEEAGDVLVVRAPALAGASEPEMIEVPLQSLLSAGDARYNVTIHPGDVIKVQQAGLIYVVGEVNRPGAFPLQGGSGLTLLQAIALGEGLQRFAATDRTTIIRTGEHGERVEIAVDVRAVLAGEVTDPRLQPKDVVFVPNNVLKATASSVADALVRMITLRDIF
jgi:polysaccharide biosynthesis/export protein